MKIRFEGTVEVKFDDKKLDELIEKFVSCIKRCDMGYVPEQPHPDEDYSDVDPDATLDEDPDVDLFAPLDDDCVDVEPDATVDVDPDATLDENHEDVEPDTAQKKETAHKGERGQTGGKKRSVKKQVNVQKSGRTDQEVENFKNMLEEIAQNSANFEQFVENVAQQLKLGKQGEFLKQLVFTATNVEELTWSVIEEKMGDISSKKVMLSQKLKKKKAPATLYLLMMTMQYMDYSFGDKQPKEEFDVQATEKMVSATMEEDEGAPKNRVKMECMPEIPWFEETLGSVDKTQPIEDRVRYVLTAMGMEKINVQKQQKIFEIANTAVRLGRIAFDIIFVKANIPMESSMNARLTFSTFVNDFVSQYDSKRKVKLLDFLKELQEVVMYKSEIESFEEFEL